MDSSEQRCNRDQPLKFFFFSDIVDHATPLPYGQQAGLLGPPPASGKPLVNDIRSDGQWGRFKVARNLDPISSNSSCKAPDRFC